MNFLKKGPEVKLSELKIPDFVYDLYYDLKERHLLPLVVILLVAMVAVPIFLESSKDSGDEEPSATPPTATASVATDGGKTLVVARTEPGLRELQRRFKHYRALDPFAEKSAVGATSESAAEEAGETGGEAGETAPTVTEEPPAEAVVVGGEASASPPPEPSAPVAAPSAPTKVPAGSPPPASSGHGEPTLTRYASNSIDVRIVAVPPAPQSSEGTEKQAEQKPQAESRHNLPELTMLPSRATPAVAFMGTSRDGKKALFLVSSDVVSIFGEGNCVIGSQTCQLLALEPGLPETFVYGPQERTYRIELLKITRTLSAKPRRATLGTAKEGEKEGPAQSEQMTARPAGRGEAAESPAG